MSRVFMDGGSSINLMFASTLAAMRIPLCSLEQSDTTFHGIVPGKGIYPLGKIWLDVIFVKPENFRCERLEFEVVDWPSQYHASGIYPQACSICKVPSSTALRVPAAQDVWAQRRHHSP